MLSDIFQIRIRSDSQNLCMRYSWTAMSDLDWSWIGLCLLLTSTVVTLLNRSSVVTTRQRFHSGRQTNNVKTFLKRLLTVTVKLCFFFFQLTQNWSLQGAILYLQYYTAGTTNNTVPQTFTQENSSLFLSWLHLIACTRRWLSKVKEQYTSMIFFSNAMSAYNDF